LRKPRRNGAFGLLSLPKCFTPFRNVPSDVAVQSRAAGDLAGK
jgi:hypothetical protein